MMMMEANDGSSMQMDGIFGFEDDVMLDLGDLWETNSLDDDFNREGGMSEDSPFVDFLKGEQNSQDLSTEDVLTGLGAQFMPQNSESSESRREFSDSSLQNGLSSGQFDGYEGPSETLNHSEPFDFHGANRFIHNRGSLDLNDSDITQLETSSYDELSSYHGSNHFIHKRDASDASNLNHEEHPFGITGYSGLHAFGNELENPFNTLKNGYHKIQSRIKVKRDTDSFTSGDIVSRANGVVNDVIGRKYYLGSGQLSSIEGIEWTPSNSLSSISCNNNVPQAKDEKEERSFEPKRTLPFPGRAGETEIPVNSSAVGSDWRPIRHVSKNLGILPSKVETNSIKMENEMTNYAFVVHDWSPVVQLSEHPVLLPPPTLKVEKNSVKMENEMPNSALVSQGWRSPQVSENLGIMSPPSINEETELLNMEIEMAKFNDTHISKITYQEVQNSTGEQRDVDDDPDVCILEGLSGPARPNLVAMNAKLAVTSQFSTSREPGVQVPTTHSRFKTYDERVIFRAALQDLTQPKSEATPPDGLLSVPLLKHQRIALSWMVNKETKSACCSGGILADDQGLGKTISTISLILKERSPSSKGSKTNEKQTETETLNLDDDDDEAPETEPSRVDGFPIKASPPAKGRASGGTLIVCPTSVLRQWSEELHNKVTREANLSVLVYYGSNRTKDPIELAKYDVVVTTYAIVSMEVPKQPVVNENENQIDSPFKENSSCGKRKQSETNSFRSKKSRKGDDSELVENTYGPLAQVGWFRVVLDEAQSIKNHRTQVARACWGLRAKRRWCLSGTPIQNAIDDLYSYFRFLRHEPYAVFKTFCEHLKVPIQRNPKNGYKKLQAVLKTIMLRRTKGTYIDGEPIINLPPKKIELKKVDFSEEERGFYSRLEADSRAQFEEYAAAGTVKQNYVNILLMLLRLRQACDHPLLVKGFNSTSKMMSSIEMAKKLSREKQIFLLNCLEASLAICGICSDPPEDAVVTVCGHVFCSQCICQHIIGDGTQCPAKKCKSHLTMASVFSITTLRIALSDQLPSTENIAICTDSKVAEVSEPRSLNCPEDSSKIRAALEILLSLSVKRDCASEKSCVSDTDSSEDRVSQMNTDSNSLVNFVPEKAIVFSQWTGMLDLLEAGLKNTSLQYRRLDGTMTVAARDRAVKDFNSLPQVSVMIMSLKAASLGLNMVAACNVLLLDLWWNPTTEDQAIDRAHRIGQTRPVSVFRLTVKDTVEDRILALQQKKRKMVASAFGEDETGSRQTRLTVDDLKYLFRN